LAIEIMALYKPTMLDGVRPFLNTLWYGLYVNDRTPGQADTLADYTECTDATYKASGKQQPNFQPSFLNGDFCGETDGNNLVWSFDHAGGDFTIYGYFVATAKTGGGLVYAERATVPFQVTAARMTYVVPATFFSDTATTCG
jgi:hypothetical protein